MKDANYSKWASFFKPMCGKFGMKPHINGTSLQQLTTDPLWPFWDPADCCIRSYIYGSVGNTVLNLTMEGDDQWLTNSWLHLNGYSAPTRSHVLSSCTMSSTPWSRATPSSQSTARR